MKIHKVLLENIRSYEKQEIVFPEGSCLLWGNIGSGKSSVLLAIDFALFGIQRENLSGAALLRNGASSGSITLNCNIDGEEVVLYRSLKRGKAGVSQDPGYIIRNGVKEDKTAQELKQLVLDLLNYPKELLTKNKSLIYRYTVYTPQEEMKQILLGKKEERLDTLRKVFGIDKYKQIGDNAKVVVTHIRAKKRLYEGAVIDLPSKILEKEKKEEEKVLLNSKLQSLKPELEAKKLVWERKKEELQSFQVKREELMQVKKDLAVCEAELRHKIQEKVMMGKELTC